MQLKPNPNGHFYASNAAEWRVDTDVVKLVKSMKSAGYPFALIYVPLPIEAKYKIEFYVPVVDDCILLAEYIK